MSKQHELFVGQKFKKKLQGHTTELEIVALSAHDVTLKATGEFVANADKPRVIPISRFVSWEGQTPNVPKVHCFYCTDGCPHCGVGSAYQE